VGLASARSRSTHFHAAGVATQHGPASRQAVGKSNPPVAIRPRLRATLPVVGNLLGAVVAVIDLQAAQAGAATRRGSPGRSRTWRVGKDGDSAGAADERDCLTGVNFSRAACPGFPRPKIAVEGVISCRWQRPIRLSPWATCGPPDRSLVAAISSTRSHPQPALRSGATAGPSASARRRRPSRRPPSACRSSGDLHVEEISRGRGPPNPRHVGVDLHPRKPPPRPGRRPARALRERPSTMSWSVMATAPRPRARARFNHFRRRQRSVGERCVHVHDRPSPSGDSFIRIFPGARPNKSN